MSPSSTKEGGPFRIWYHSILAQVTMKISQSIHAPNRALTLLELVVVLGILAILVRLITYSLNPNTLTFAGSGRNHTTPTIVTESTMKTLKEAILGAPGQPGLWNDMDKVNRAFPLYTAPLFIAPDVIAAAVPTAPMSVSILNNAQWATSLISFNPRTGKGWRGPYLSVTGGTYPYTADATNRYFTGDLHPAALGTIPVPVDGWGNPIVIQWGILSSSESLTLTAAQADQVYVNHARMISAGPNGVLDSLKPSSKAVLLKYSDFVADRAAGGALRSGDDVITFFFWPALQ